jgi:hypothetical protein
MWMAREYAIALVSPVAAPARSTTPTHWYPVLDRESERAFGVGW